MQASMKYPVKFFLMGVFFLGLLAYGSQVSFIGKTYATENQDMSTVPVLTAKDSIASIGVYNVSLNNQVNNEIALGFDIVNHGLVQPSVLYGVRLFHADNTVIPVDQKIYTADVLNFGAGETLHKEIKYSASAYLNGAYIIEVSLNNTDGLIMGGSQSPQFSLTGNSESVVIDQSSCFLTIDGKDGQYSVDQGVDISKEETLVAHCSAKSNFSKDVSMVPVIETHYRSVAGKIVDTKKQDAVTLTIGQAIDFETRLFKADNPQAYDAVLTFTDEKSTIISPSIVFHYVIQGQSATIQNFILDKDSYSKNDVAKMDLTWTGAADNFPQARAQSVSSKKDVVVSILMNNNQNKACALELSQLVHANRSGIKDSFEMPITADCNNPVATVKISDTDGRVLAQNKYSIDSKNSSVSKDIQDDVIASVVKQSSLIPLVYGIAFISLILLLVYLMKKNKTTRVRVFVGFLMGLGMFVSGGCVKADTFAVPVWYGFYPYEGYVGNIEQSMAGLTVDIDSPTRSYVSGAAMKVFGNSSTTNCDNAFGSKLTATVNGVTQVVTDGTFPNAGKKNYPVFPFHRSNVSRPSFVVPTNPGTYNVTFILYEYVLRNSGSPIPCNVWIQTSPNGQKLCGNADGTAAYVVAAVNIPYTVVAPVEPIPPVPVDPIIPVNSVCVWTPDPAEVCSQKTVNQTRCGETRRVSGTKTCPIGKWNEIPPVK